MHHATSKKEPALLQRRTGCYWQIFGSCTHFPDASLVDWSRGTLVANGAEGTCINRNDASVWMHIRPPCISIKAMLISADTWDRCRLINVDCHACMQAYLSDDMSASQHWLPRCYQSTTTTTHFFQDAPCPVRRRHLALTMLLNRTSGFASATSSHQDSRPNVTHHCTGAQGEPLYPGGVRVIHTEMQPSFFTIRLGALTNNSNMLLHLG